MITAAKPDPARLPPCSSADSNFLRINTYEKHGGGGEVVRLQGSPLVYSELRVLSRHNLLSFHAFAASLAHGKRSTPLESALCRLFFQNQGGGICAKSSLLESTTTGQFLASPTIFPQNLCLFAVRTARTPHGKRVMTPRSRVSQMIGGQGDSMLNSSPQGPEGS